MNEKRIGCLYIRVSTGKQEELSPESQKDKLLEYAAAHNIYIPEEYIFFENGISGRKADKRPKFQQMIALAKKKERTFDVILVWKFSRFARNQEESIVYKSMLKRDNVDVISISEPLADGPFGSLIERIIEWMDEYYSIRLSGDVFRGMTKKAQIGGYQARPPLGYKIPGHNLQPVIVPEEAEIVKTIFNMYANGKGMYDIARHLNSMGAKTSRGSNFERRSIDYILQNPTYIGKIRWNRTKNDSNEIKPEDEWIISDGHFEPIISKELWDTVQDRINKEYLPRYQKPAAVMKHYFSGIVKCSACGRSLSSTHRVDNRYGTAREYFHFDCYGYKKGKCNVSNGISGKKLLEAVLQSLRNVLQSGIVEYKIREKKKLPVNDEFILKKRLEELIKKEHRAKEAYINGIDSIEEYKQNKELISDERNELNKKLSSIAPAINKAEMDKTMLERIRKTFETLSDEDASFEKKRNSVVSVIDKIVYDKSEGRLEVFYFFE